MPVPKRKVSKRRRDMRSANKGLKPQPVVFCWEADCKGYPRLPHQVCEKCGYYRGKNVLGIKSTAQTSEAAAQAE